MGNEGEEETETSTGKHPLLQAVAHNDLITSPTTLYHLAQQLCHRFYHLPQRGHGLTEPRREGVEPLLRALLADPAAALRSRRPHITTSSVLMNASRTATALVLHRRVGEWLYPGGHPDGQWNWLASAARECREETAATDLVALIATEDRIQFKTSGPQARQREIALPKLVVHHLSGDHDHLDFVYAFETATENLKPAPAEASSCKWFPILEIQRCSHGEPLLSPESAAVILELWARVGHGDVRISA